MEYSSRKKRFKCLICKEWSYLPSDQLSKNSTTPLKKNCLKKECRVQAYTLAYDKQKADKWKATKETWKKELGISTKSHQEPLQKAINKLVRLLDEGKSCIVLGGHSTVKLEAGHSISVGANPTMRYCLLNIHGESQKSNNNQAVTNDQRVEAIGRRYGNDQVEALREMVAINKTTGLNKALKSLKKNLVNQLIKRVEKGELLTRRYCDEYIGIYELSDKYRI